LDTRLDSEEPKITALQTLTANHSTDIAFNTNNIASLDVDLFTEQQKHNCFTNTNRKSFN